MYFAPSFFSPFYYTPLISLVGEPSPANGLLPVYRDRDAFDAICELIHTTGEFADVLLAEPLENASIPSGHFPLAVIQPIEWEEADDSDPIVILRRVSFDLVLVCRCDDSGRGFAILERLSSIVQNVISGSSLNGECLPAFTLIRRGKIDRKASQHPEHRMILKGEFCYFVQSANGHGSLD